MNHSAPREIHRIRPATSWRGVATWQPRRHARGSIVRVGRFGKSASSRFQKTDGADGRRASSLSERETIQPAARQGIRRYIRTAFRQIAVVCRRIQFQIPAAQLIRSRITQQRRLARAAGKLPSFNPSTRLRSPWPIASGPSARPAPDPPWAASAPGRNGRALIRQFRKISQRHPLLAEQIDHLLEQSASLPQTAHAHRAVQAGWQQIPATH